MKVERQTDKDSGKGEISRSLVGDTKVNVKKARGTKEQQNNKKCQIEREVSFVKKIKVVTIDQ